eukprot:scaffold77344_cov65-Phaeocystis_antarctica.AAC.3
MSAYVQTGIGLALNALCGDRHRPKRTRQACQLVALANRPVHRVVTRAPPRRAKSFLERRRRGRILRLRHRRHQPRCDARGELHLLASRGSHLQPRLHTPPQPDEAAA